MNTSIFQFDSPAWLSWANDALAFSTFTLAVAATVGITALSVVVVRNVKDKTAARDLHERASNEGFGLIGY